VDVLATVAPAVISLAWVAVRRQLPNVDVALILVLAVTASGATGRRLCLALGAVGAAAGFAFFDTRPYERWVISRQPDLETLVVLAVVSAVTGELAVRATHLRRARAPGSDGLDRVREIAALVASGAELVSVLAAVGNELTRLLQASGSVYEAGEVPAGALAVGRDGELDRTGPRRRPDWGQRDGTTPGAPRAWNRRALEVPVTGMDRVLGRFVVADPAHALDRGTLLVALTLADQAGAALIAQAPESADPHLPTAPDTPQPALRVVD
jgi:K+-sensing histidine kinase KdpD